MSVLPPWPHRALLEPSLAGMMSKWIGSNLSDSSPFTAPRSIPVRMMQRRKANTTKSVSM